MERLIRLHRDELEQELLARTKYVGDCNTWVRAREEAALHFGNDDVDSYSIEEIGVMQ